MLTTTPGPEMRGSEGVGRRGTKLTSWSVEAGLAGPHMCMFGLLSGRRRRVSPPSTEDLKVS